MGFEHAIPQVGALRSISISPEPTNEKAIPSQVRGARLRRKPSPAAMQVPAPGFSSVRETDMLGPHQMRGNRAYNRERHPNSVLQGFPRHPNASFSATPTAKAASARTLSQHPGIRPEEPALAFPLRDHHKYLIEVCGDRGHWRTSADKQDSQVEKTTIAVRLGIRHVGGGATYGWRSPEASINA